MKKIRKFKKEKPLLFWAIVGILIIGTITLVVELNADYLISVFPNLAN